MNEHIVRVNNILFWGNKYEQKRFAYSKEANPAVFFR